MKSIPTKKIKIGDELLFPDLTVESHYTIRINISRQFVRRIYGSQIITKRLGANYEEEQYFAYDSLDEAKKYLIKNLNREKKYRTKYLKEEYNRALEKIKIFKL